MLCEVAALQFQAHAIYVTWSIDFDKDLLYSVQFSILLE